MNKEEFLSKIWSYYIMLENDFSKTFQYVEPVEGNKDCFSKEFNKELLSIGSEIDIVCRELCMVIEGKNFEQVKNYSIVNYREIIAQNENFMKESCIFISNEEILEPWNEWKKYDSPQWWRAYNDIKHNRLVNDNHKLGNFLNVKLSLAALFIICRVLYSKQYEKEPFPSSSLFKMNNWKIYEDMGNGLTKILEPNGSITIK